MELKRQNIHREIGKAEGNIQAALEEDVNVAENKPDVDKILYAKGKVKIEEIKATTSHAAVKGKIIYDLLYRTLEGTQAIQAIHGVLPFSEEIYMNGLETGNHVNVQGTVEDLTVNTINSRKLNIRSLLSLHANARETGEEEICVELTDAGTIACQKENKDFLELVSHKKDVFRLKDEVIIPKNYPNIVDIIWQDSWLQDFSYQPQEGQILLKGNLVIFVLYNGIQYVAQNQDAENMEQSIQQIAWYQTTIPFQGSLTEPNSHSGMLADIQAELVSEPIEIRQDADQEPRAFGIEAVIDMDIYLYQPLQMEIMSDAYGVDQEVVCTRKQGYLQKLTMQQSETARISDTISVPKEEAPKQILYSTGNIHLEDAKIEMQYEKQNIVLSGYLQATVLYQIQQENGEKEQFATVKTDIPFTVKIPIGLQVSACRFHIETYLQEIEASIIEETKMDVNAAIQFVLYAYCEEEQELLEDIKSEPLDYEKIKELPGMMIYFVKDQDSLWQIGKKYYMNVDKIKELNHLTGDSIKAGDKLLLMKSLT